jgi:hypothetical protein
MSATPLLDRINGTLPAPTPITERMSPFMRRLAEKRLPVADKTVYVNGAWTPGASDKGA